MEVIEFLMRESAFSSHVEHDYILLLNIEDGLQGVGILIASLRILPVARMFGVIDRQ